MARLTLLQSSVLALLSAPTGQSLLLAARSKLFSRNHYSAASSSIQRRPRLPCPMRNRCCNLRAVHHAYSMVASSWKPCAQPRFDDFASCIVGPWTGTTTTTTTTTTATTESIREVEEVMRSCGGAIQGIRELPLSSFIIPGDEKASEEERRTYHNRADGGFVYDDDGSYTAGPEQWDWSVSDDEECSSKKLVMASLAYPGGRRIWLTVNLSDATEAVSKKCVPAEEEGNVFRQIIVNTNALDLSRPFSNRGSGDPGTGTIEWESSQLSVDLRSIKRVRMPDPSQTWSLARAKWEKQINEGSGGEADATIVKSSKMGNLVGWSFIEKIPPENLDHGDAIATGGAINLHMLSVCPVTKVTRSVVRCHDANGSLKSVAFFHGSLSN
jgi:hypothetical protein